jgi:hypothetical protein
MDIELDREYERRWIEMMMMMMMMMITISPFGPVGCGRHLREVNREYVLVATPRICKTIRIYSSEKSLIIFIDYTLCIPQEL